MPAKKAEKKEVEEAVEVEVTTEAIETEIEPSTAAYLGDTPEESVFDIIDAWRARLHDAALNGTLSQVGPLLDCFATPVSTHSWVVDRVGHYTIMAEYKNKRWQFHAELNP
jgi:hypothetical protein